MKNSIVETPIESFTNNIQNKTILLALMNIFENIEIK